MSPAEDVDENLELELVLVDFCNRAGEVGKRAFLDPHRLSELVLKAGATLLGRHVVAVELDGEERLDVAAGQR